MQLFSSVSPSHWCRYVTVDINFHVTTASAFLLMHNVLSTNLFISAMELRYVLLAISTYVQLAHTWSSPHESFDYSPKTAKAVSTCY